MGVEQKVGVCCCLNQASCRCVILQIVSLLFGGIAERRGVFVDSCTTFVFTDLQHASLGHRKIKESVYYIGV